MTPQSAPAASTAAAATMATFNYAYFCQVLTIAPRIGTKPDIIHRGPSATGLLGVFPQRKEISPAR